MEKLYEIIYKGTINRVWAKSYAEAAKQVRAMYE